MDPAAASMTFVVRVRPGDRGRLSGIVERVKTGEKHRFHDTEAIGALIAEMVRHEASTIPGAKRPTDAPAASGTDEEVLP